jgi:hypothetical protein
MARHARISWLYTRGSESVFIVEAAPLCLAVHGPGLERRVTTFSTPQDLFESNQNYANALAAEGFRFHGFGVDRRRGVERRRVSRGTADRRDA